MTDTLASPRLDAVLRRLFAAAAKDGENDAPDRSSWARMTAAELADARQDVYIPISAEGGKLLYGLVRAAARKPWWSSAPPTASRPCTWPRP